MVVALEPDEPLPEELDVPEAAELPPPEPPHPVRAPVSVRTASHRPRLA